MTREEVTALIRNTSGSLNKFTFVKSGFVDSPFISKFATLNKHEYNASYYSVYALVSNPSIHYVTVLSFYIELLQSADYNWILTDGFIDEKALDKKHFAKKGIRTHAMYIGDIRVKKEMQLSFDHVLCEPDVTALTRKIFRMFL